LQESPFIVNILEYQEDYVSIVVYLKDYAFIVDSCLLTFKDFPLEKQLLSIPVFSVNREKNSTLNTFEEGAGPDQESLSLYILKKLIVENKIEIPNLFQNKKDL
jgi:NAD-specific glutamate dehydrogenase